MEDQEAQDALRQELREAVDRMLIEREEAYGD